MITFNADTNPVGQVWALVQGALDNTTGELTGFVRSHTNSLIEGAHIRGVLIFNNSAGQNIYTVELPQCGVGGQIETHYTQDNPRYCHFKDSIPPEIATQVASIGVQTFAGAGDNEWLLQAAKILIIVAAA
jgi:hypothetical protein